MGRMRKRVFFSVVACAALTSACSSDDPDDADEEGRKDQPGNVGFAVLIRYANEAMPSGRSCPATSGIYWQVGSFENPSEEASCLVQSSGKFHVAAQGTDPLKTPPDGLISIDFEGTAETGAGMTAEIWTQTTQALESGDTPCTITTVGSVAAGELLAEFQCPLLESPDSPSVICYASGTLGLAGCGT